MAGAKHMVAGFNHNIRHNGKLYHVQTEDLGLGNPRITTHLFIGGNVVASKNRSYADIARAEGVGAAVRRMMEEQHKEMLRELVNGVYDRLDSACGEKVRAYQPGQLAPGPAPPADAAAPSTKAAVAAAARPSSPVPPPLPRGRNPSRGEASAGPVVVEAATGTLFGEDPAGEESTDEMILAYLAQDAGKSK
jgi:hypothetical protein